MRRPTRPAFSGGGERTTPPVAEGFEVSDDELDMEYARMAMQFGGKARDIRRMYEQFDYDEFYYITLYNDNYVMPPMPEGSEEGILKGLYRLRSGSPRARGASKGPWGEGSPARSADSRNAIRTLARATGFDRFTS